MSADIVIEDVPKFTRRYGDAVYQGSNNTILIFGTDRAKKGPASIGDGLGHVKSAEKGVKTGSIHIIAGRASNDPDFSKDDSFIYLTMKSDIDDNLDLGDVETAQKKSKGLILKSDAIRIVGRKDIKICVNDDQKHYIFLDGKKFKINFNTDVTIEITDKKIAAKIGDNTITVDDKKANVTVSDTKITLDGSNIKIDSPKVQLTGGCQAPWDDLFKSIIDYVDSHNHLSATGPTGPGQAGPTSIDKKADTQAKKQSWDQKVKS